MHREAGPGEYLLLVMGAFAYTSFSFVWFSLPAFLSTVIDELGLSTTQAGLLVGAVPLVYVPLGLFSGLLIDRVGPRLAIGAGIVTFGAVQVARGVAGGFLGLLVPTLALGVAGMSMTFGMPKLVSQLFPPGRTGSMSSVFQIGSQLGPAAAFGLGRPVLEPLLGGWRGVFVASGAVVLAYAVLWFVAIVVYARRRPEAAISESGSDGERAFTLESARADIGRLLSHRDMLLLVAVGAMYLFINHGLRGWLAVVLESTGLTPETAGVVTSLLIVAQMSGTVTIPPLSDRWDRRRGALAASGLLCAVGTAGLVLGPGSIVGVIAVVWIVGVGIGGLAPMVKVVPIEIEGIGPALTATAVSLVYAVGQVGGFAGPFAIGAIRDATGSFDAGLAALAVAGLVIVLASGSMRHVR